MRWWQGLGRRGRGVDLQPPKRKFGKFEKGNALGLVYYEPPLDLKKIRKFN